MNQPEFLDPALCLRLILTFAHFLWQGAAVLLLALLAARALRRASANTRYGLFVAALLVMAACPPVTFFLVNIPAGGEMPPEEPPAALARILDAEMDQAGAAHGLAIADELLAPSAALAYLPETAAVAESEATHAAATELMIEREKGRVALSQFSVLNSQLLSYAPHAVTAYLFGTAAMLLRLFLAVCGGQRLRRQAEPVDDPAILDAFNRQARALGLCFTPAIAYCRGVCVPTVIGILRPMILLPFSVATGLTPRQIEAILAHELAHVRRYDYLVNLLQRLIEAALFFHPAVWLLSRRIRIEREICCDDLVLAAGSEPVAYAGSLLRMAELSLAATDRYVSSGAGADCGSHRRDAGATPITLAATGHTSQLRTRILRLLGAPAPERIRLRRTWALALPILASMALVWANLAPAGDSGKAAAQVDAAETAEPHDAGTEEARINTAQGEPVKPAEAGGKRVREADAELVQLVSVTSNRPTERPRTFWKPDGSPLPNEPYASLGIGSNRPNPFELAIRLPPDFAYGIRPVPPAGKEASELETPFDDRYQPVLDLRGFVLFDFSDEDEETSFTLKIARSEWLTVESFDGYDWNRPGAYIIDTGTSLVFTWPRMEHNRLHVEITHTYVNDDTRLVAFDTDGRIHESKESAGGSGVGIARRIYQYSDLALDTLDRLEFQRRPYDYAITFKNVSLRPGHLTQVQVEAAPLEVETRPADMGTGAHPNAPAADTVAVRLVHPDGRPVPKARVGRWARGQGEEHETRGWSLGGESGWSDDEGRLVFRGSNLFREEGPDDQRVALYALHEDKRLTGLLEVSRSDIGKELRWVLQPACHVNGQLSSSGLDERGRQLGWTNVYVYWNEHRPLSFASTQGRFEFLLPAGRYKLRAYGTDVAAVEEAIEIEPGERQRHLEIDLPPTRIAQLAGQPAPELRRIKGWLGGEPIKLADLRGKVVLLEFWGYWCGPCIHHMPSLMDLHDDLAEKGLVIIGIHDDSLATAEELDVKLAELTEKRWAGRAIPFRIALDGGGLTSIEGTDRSVKGATTAAYGITGWPTTVLIDRDGKVVGRYTERRELEQMLGLASESPEPAAAAPDRRDAGATPETASAASTQPAESGPPAARRVAALEFRIVPNAPGSDRPPVLGDDDYIDDLRRNGPEARQERGDEFAWFELGIPRDDLPPDARIATRNGREYILLCNRRPYVLTVTAGLKEVRTTQDTLGRPALLIEFGDDAAAQMKAFTSQHSLNTLTVLVDGQVMTSARIHSVVERYAQVAGRFTQEQVEEMAARLRPAVQQVDDPLPDRQDQGGQRPRDAAATPETAWRTRFDEVYRLEEAETVRRIAPPFIPERLNYYRNEHAGQARQIARPPGHFQFRWDGRLKNYGMGFVDKLTLSNVLSILGLPRNEYEGPAELLDLPVPGDWVVREDSSREARLKALEEVLATQLERHITFESLEVEREVLVASGTYKHQPILGIASRDPKSIQLFAETIDRDDGAGGGTSDLAGFLRNVGSRLNMWAINEALTEPDLQVVWNNNDDLRQRDRSPEEQRAWQDMILNNITRQTSLRFHRQRRVVSIWRVSEKPEPDAAGHNSGAAPASMPSGAVLPVRPAGGTTSQPANGHHREAGQKAAPARPAEVWLRSQPNADHGLRWRPGSTLIDARCETVQPRLSAREELRRCCCGRWHG